MSTDDEANDQRRQALRLALGVTVAFVVTQLFGWPLAYVMPVLLSLFLRAPAPPSLGTAITLLVTSGGCMIGGLALAGVAVHFPLLSLLLIAVLMPWIFVFAARGGAMITVIAMLLAIMVLPIVAQSSLSLAGAVAWAVWFDIVIALVFTALSFAAIPPPAKAVAAPPATPVPAVSSVLAPALRITAIVFPLAVAFLVFGWGSILTLIFTAMLAQQLSGAAGLRAGLLMILANAVGGALAVVAYSLLTAAPSPVLMTGLVLAATLAAAGNLFSNRPTAKLWGSALNATLVILGGSLGAFGTEADAKLDARLIQIALAVLYVAAAYTVVDTFRKREPAAAVA